MYAIKKKGLRTFFFWVTIKNEFKDTIYFDTKESASNYIEHLISNDLFDYENNVLRNDV
jgi:hypothetical protein